MADQIKAIEQYFPVVLFVLRRFAKCDSLWILNIADVHSLIDKVVTSQNESNSIYSVYCSRLNIQNVHKLIAVLPSMGPERNFRYKGLLRNHGM